ncbi:transposase [Sulfitobacter sp. NFXS29]
MLIGADEWGRKEVLGLTDGYRESTQSWRELLLDLRRRGLSPALRNWPSATALLGSGRRCARYLAVCVSTAAGSTKPAMFRTRCRNPYNPRPRVACTTSGRLRQWLRQKPPSISSSRPMA